MKRVSTNLTLFLKMFLPLFWLVFFGCFMVAFWLVDDVESGVVTIENLRMGTTVFWAIGALLFFFTVIKLKRVEMAPDFVYATNYIKTARYPYSNIEKIVEKDFLLFHTVHIHFKKKGIFGKKITFIPSRFRFQSFLNEHPDVVNALLERKPK